MPKKPEAPFLSTTGSSSRGSSRGSIATQWPPTCSSPSAGTFWSQSPPSFRSGPKPIVVKTTDRPLARATSSSRFVASTSAFKSEPSVLAGSVNPQLKSTTSTAGREPSVTLPAESRSRVDLPGVLVAHRARTPSLPAGSSSSPERARLTNWPAPGEATSSSFSTITWPRTSTTSGAPVTCVPSNRL